MVTTFSLRSRREKSESKNIKQKNRNPTTKMKMVSQIAVQKKPLLIIKGTVQPLTANISL